MAKACSRSAAISADTEKPTPALIEQKIRKQYLNKVKLKALCTKKSGPNNFKINVRMKLGSVHFAYLFQSKGKGNWILMVPVELTEVCRGSLQDATSRVKLTVNVIRKKGFHVSLVAKDESTLRLETGFASTKETISMTSFVSCCPRIPAHDLPNVVVYEQLHRCAG